MMDVIDQFQSTKVGHEGRDGGRKGKERKGKERIGKEGKEGIKEGRKEGMEGRIEGPFFRIEGRKEGKGNKGS